ncbi:hypothetical protein BWI97_07245 [Siphonobacter sp. BAB-5405]|uniref:hypothetical protein n=1 Tax=Siphonobacter sp. BAB-5405 TaxID=1864825 RepID=UPI000C80E09C|nr:hypothetical protein [Siphonobacter sp. BAB-5405]PMD97418.1 hypothetical protein BWI97_07245 [Siphonobacter sp. BAB-5405]
MKNEKLDKYKLYYTGDMILSEEEMTYLSRYEDIQDKLADDGYTRSDVVKYVMTRYKVSKQMANRVVNEAADLYGSTIEIHRKAERSFQIEKLQRAASMCLSPGTDPESGMDLPADLGNYERIMNQINKLNNLYEPDPEQTDDPKAYDVVTHFQYEAIEDTTYEEVTEADSTEQTSDDAAQHSENPSESGTIAIPESTSTE